MRSPIPYVVSNSGEVNEAPDGAISIDLYGAGSGGGGSLPDGDDWGQTLVWTGPEPASWQPQYLSYVRSSDDNNESSVEAYIGSEGELIAQIYASQNNSNDIIRLQASNGSIRATFNDDPFLATEPDHVLTVAGASASGMATMAQFSNGDVDIAVWYGSSSPWYSLRFHGEVAEGPLAGTYGFSAPVSDGFDSEMTIFASQTVPFRYPNATVPTIGWLEFTFIVGDTTSLGIPGKTVTLLINDIVVPDDSNFGPEDLVGQSISFNI